MSDTIAAIATALGESGVAVVRVSGPDALAIAGRLLPVRASRDGTPARDAPPGDASHGDTSHRGGPLADAPTHTVRHAWLHDADGRRLDEALVTVMRAPRTYTGEDVVEIGVHGGAVPARRVLRALLAAGARAADRGEFTKRAFLHGRIDLSRAEAVADVISARTERAADAALAALAGKLAERTLDVEGALLDLLARLEANLDFAEDVRDDVTAVERSVVGDRLAACRAALAELERRVPWGRRLRDGASVVLVGRPNVGKSSLFNALLQDERALVGERPGTTRDWIEAWVDLGGVPVRLIDTAGLRAADSDVEAEGVRRAGRRERESDLRLVVLDAEEGCGVGDDEVLRRTAGAPRVLVWNKVDRAVVPPQIDGEAAAAVSAVTGAGVAALRDLVGAALLEGVGREPDDDVVPGERHADAIRRALASLDLARDTWRDGASEELIAGDLRDAVASLGEITGKTVGEEVLDRIFSRFCIGK